MLRGVSPTNAAEMSVSQASGRGDRQKGWRRILVENARQAMRTVVAEGELAARQSEVVDARAALRLLELGSRPAEIDAQRVG